MIECPTCPDTFETEHGRNVHHAHAHEESLVQVEIECPSCGSIREKRKKKAANRVTDYCTDCLSELRKEYPRESDKVDVECDWCGTVHNEYPSNIRCERYFCDMDCRDAFFKTDEFSDEISEKIKEVWEQDEHRKRISEINRGQQPSHADISYIDTLGHYTDSSWEIAVGIILRAHCYQYKHEPKFPLSNGRAYYPDFQVWNVIIEVKGYADDYSIEKAQLFLDEYPDYTYLVIGDEIPGDVQIECRDVDDIWNQTSDIVTSLQACL